MQQEPLRYNQLGMMSQMTHHRLHGYMYVIWAAGYTETHSMTGAPKRKKKVGPQIKK